ncbi:hypothetical protein PS925_05295 [Pseudomonas fluorescens]|uniref:Uncharacterized protein n=1 Tax=Pseudomonas fluorescens TaxID=294 RepID=A0A5E7VKQ3_PSEFL|nr:hypothetical protein [Pseudomonas fluorescens]VVQ23341.1 hypothetical protein PS925_05295 [Pseudomonas fluorescens]
MAKSKTRKPINPGFESTIWIDQSHVVESASAFADVAIALSSELSPHGDPKLNVIFTNGSLALELFFKSQLIERIVEPAFVEMTPEGERITTEEHYINQELPNFVVAIHHSRLKVKEGCKSHELVKLYECLDQDTQVNILRSISNETLKIQTKADLLDFLSVINNFFVDKRYHFEGFINGVESDRVHLYTLLPVLKGVKSALAI